MLSHISLEPVCLQSHIRINFSKRIYRRETQNRAFEQRQK